MPDPQDLITDQKTVRKDVAMTKTVNKALKRRPRAEHYPALDQLAEKQAISDVGLLGGLIGALRAPKGSRTEGYARGARRGGITGLGMIGGGLAGGIGGAALGGPAGVPLGALAGAGVGGIGGFMYGGRNQPKPTWKGGEMTDEQRNKIHGWGTAMPALAGVGLGSVLGPPGMIAGGLGAGMLSHGAIDKRLPGNTRAEQEANRVAEATEERKEKSEKSEEEPKEEKEDAPKEKAAYAKLAALVPHVPGCRTQTNSSYGASAWGGPTPVRTDSGNGLSDQKLGAPKMAAAWPGVFKQV